MNKAGEKQRPEGHLDRMLKDSRERKKRLQKVRLGSRKTRQGSQERELQEENGDSSTTTMEAQVSHSVSPYLLPDSKGTASLMSIY